MRTVRKHARFIRRLEVECSVNEEYTRCISSNFSLGGLFVRTSRPFAPGTLVDLNIHLPDGKAAKARGRVKTAQKTALTSLKNGMGIELIEKDMSYVTFIKSLGSDAVDEAPEATPSSAAHAGSGQDDFFIISCPQCGVKNRVKTSRSSPGMKCGKCGGLLRAS